MTGLEILNHLRELNMESVALRMLLGLLFGGIIGIERGSKQRAAGFRTYMLVCLGAVLTILLGQYEHHMLTNVWTSAGGTTDVARFGAQVISGIGFLGAGTIIVTGRQEVKGLTTGAGLWSCACMGLAIGAGFYECVVLAFILIALSIRVLPWVENLAVERARYINLYMEFESMDSIGIILSTLKSADVQVQHVELTQEQINAYQRPGAIFSLKVKNRRQRESMLVSLAKVSEVYTVESI